MHGAVHGVRSVAARLRRCVRRQCDRQVQVRREVIGVHIEGLLKRCDRGSAITAGELQSTDVAVHRRRGTHRAAHCGDERVVLAQRCDAVASLVRRERTAQRRRRAARRRYSYGEQPQAAQHVPHFK